MAQEGGKGRKLLGWILVGLGALSVVDFFSPIPIPTVGAAALISGGILLIAGLGVLKLGDLNWRGLIGLRSAQGQTSQPRRRTRVDPLVPVAILKLARERGGLLSVSTVVIALSLPLDVAEGGLQECVERGVATPDYDEAHATLVYRFPEFLPPAPESERPELPDGT